jgi:pyruvate,water dikinase
MSVGFLEMVNARAAGVLYTQDPHEATSNTMIINAAWGLGPYVVDGTVAPDMFRVSKETGEVVESEVAVKELMLAPAEGGVRQETVPEELRRQPALSGEQIARLVEYGLKIEEHFRHPQDIEWALDQEGRLYILQARPLRLVAAGQATDDEKPDLSGCDVLLAQGVCAAPGAGTGPVWVVRQEEDLAAFPDGAVLVARNPSPKFVTVMNRAKAIVCDLGGATGHMATLAREFQVPTLVNAGRATELLKPGEVVTVAASLRMVFRGAVEALTCAREARANILEETPLFAVMDRILDLVVPLNLIDPGDASFKPEGCRTVHDIIRFAHQAALQEMFAVAEDRQLREQGDAVKLDLHIPLVIYVIDLGGGLSPDSPAKVVELPHVLSQPFRAFLAGLTALKWPGPPPLDPRGFASVVVHTMTEARAREEFATGSFAIVSPLYMNFSLRLGYHLSTIEAYCSPHDNDNYIRFNFRGGGASEDRRGRRARLVGTILQHFAFQVIRKRDMVDAQLTHEPAAAILEKLEMLGRLTVHTKQLDMVMFNDAIVDWSIEEFLGRS